MTQMLELSDKDFKTAIIKLLQEDLQTLEINGGGGASHQKMNGQK